jgi:hypothetical protein
MENPIILLRPGAWGREQLKVSEHWACIGASGWGVFICDHCVTQVCVIHIYILC